MPWMLSCANWTVVTPLEMNRLPSGAMNHQRPSIFSAWKNLVVFIGRVLCRSSVEQPATIRMPNASASWWMIFIVLPCKSIGTHPCRVNLNPDRHNRGVTTADWIIASPCTKASSVPLENGQMWKPPLVQFNSQCPKIPRPSRYPS